MDGVERLYYVRVSMLLQWPEQSVMIADRSAVDIYYAWTGGDVENYFERRRRRRWCSIKAKKSSTEFYWTFTHERGTAQILTKS